MAELAPPSVEQQKDDPGAHELAESSDDHFSDASEGQGEDHGASLGEGLRTRSNTAGTSPIPVTRVERVDEEPSYGEVPGTTAYKLRAQDAVPDEVEVIPDGQRSRSASRVSQTDRPLTPGGTMIPKTVVEKVEPDNLSYGEVPGTVAYEKRKADAEPDEVLTSPAKTRLDLEEEGEPTTDRSAQLSVGNDDVGNDELVDDADGPLDGVGAEDGLDGDEDGFGDDFDDFEEGEEVQGDDFGDFGDGADVVASETADQPAHPPPDALDGFPTIDLEDFRTPAGIQAAMNPYMAALFPPHAADDTSEESFPPEPLLSDRSASLWAQLVAPPPLQPLNWTKSRIRRLFLVSLGVPVDLDEILPASKQKKLILPSIHLHDEPASAVGHLQGISENNASSASVATTDSKTGEVRRERRRKGPADRAGPPPPPRFDSNAASLLCSTTETALVGLSDGDLRAHVSRLEETVADAERVLEYWVGRRESAVGDKEAFEGVIENLVGFVAKSKANAR